MYTDYCRSFPDGTERLNELKRDKHFNALCQRFSKDSRCLGQSIESLRVMPIQRLPRYELFLREFLKETNQSLDVTDLEAKEHVSVLQLLDGVSQINSSINETIREKERISEIYKIEISFRPRPPIHLLGDKRTLHKRGMLELIEIRKNKSMKRPQSGQHLGKVVDSKLHHYHFFLFNDLLLIGKKHNMNTFHYRWLFYLHHAAVHDLHRTAIGSASKLQHCFIICGLTKNLEKSSSSEKKDEKSFSLLLSAKSNIERKSWCTALSSKCQISKNRNKLWKNFQEMHTSVAALLTAAAKVVPMHPTVELGEHVSVYSKSAKKWYDAIVIDIDATNGDFRVSYVIHEYAKTHEKWMRKSQTNLYRKLNKSTNTLESKKRRNSKPNSNPSLACSLSFSIKRAARASSEKHNFYIRNTSDKNIVLINVLKHLQAEAEFGGGVYYNAWLSPPNGDESVHSEPLQLKEVKVNNNRYVYVRRQTKLLKNSNEVVSKFGGVSLTGVLTEVMFQINLFLRRNEVDKYINISDGDILISIGGRPASDLSLTQIRNRIKKICSKGNFEERKNKERWPGINPAGKLIFMKNEYKRLLEMIE
eukprot:g1065.t1